MQISRRFGFFICAGLLSAALHGCGGSSTSDTIPSTVSIFYEHSLVFRNHTTFTMGYNGFGQLGDGSLDRREKATPVPGMTGMTKGAVGAEHSMVMNGTNEIHTWGYNLYGQLGSSAVSTSYPDAYSSSPVTVTFSDPVTDIAAGGYHSLAVAGGKLYGWGYNGYRQVGNGSSSEAKTPVPLSAGHDNEDLTQLTANNVTAGWLHSMALFSNGDLYAWGSNAKGQLGFSTYSSSSSRPKKVTIPEATGKIEQIAALSRGSLALEVQRDAQDNITGQTLWGWGYNDSGELGSLIPLLSYSAVPVKVIPTIAVTDGQSFVIKKIVTGINHVLLLMGPRDTLVNDGSWYVQGLGLNFYGQLGDNTTTDTSSLVAVYTALTPGWSTGVSDIAAFGTASFALVNGVWYGWGNNDLGQLGNPVVKDTVAFFERPVTVKFQ